MMFGQMTAGSWIYIGSQGIVQGTHETFVEMGRRHFGGKLQGKWILTAGLGGMGGAQPLAATMAGASILCIECQQSRIQKRLDTRYLDAQAPSLDAALKMIAEAGAGKAALCGYLIPPLALAYGALLLDEEITPASIAGLVLILAGVALASGEREGDVAPGEPVVESATASRS